MYIMSLFTVKKSYYIRTLKTNHEVKEIKFHTLNRMLKLIRYLRKIICDHMVEAYSGNGLSITL